MRYNGGKSRILLLSPLLCDLLALLSFRLILLINTNLEFYRLFNGGLFVIMIL